MGQPMWPPGLAGPPAPPSIGPRGLGEEFESPRSTHADKA